MFLKLLSFSFPHEIKMKLHKNMSSRKMKLDKEMSRLTKVFQKDSTLTKVFQKDSTPKNLLLFFCYIICAIMSSNKLSDHIINASKSLLFKYYYLIMAKFTAC